MQKGRLLFQLATEEEKGLNKALFYLVMVLTLVGLAAGVLVVLPRLDDLFPNPTESEKTFVLILFFLWIGGFSFFSVQLLNGKKKDEASRLYLYENCVEGTTDQKWGLGIALENFCFSYADIINVSSMERFVVIHTKWKSYKILSFKKQDEIIRIINEQRENATKTT